MRKTLPPCTRTFTLVEIMVALAVLLLMMSFLITFANGARKVFTETTRQNTLFNGAQAVLTRMDNDLKNLVCSYRPGCLLPFYHEEQDACTLLGFYTAQPSATAQDSPETQTRLYPVIYLHDQETHRLYRFIWTASNSREQPDSEDAAPPIAATKTPWDAMGCESVTDENFTNVFLHMKTCIQKATPAQRLNWEVMDNVSEIRITALTPDGDGIPIAIPEGTHSLPPTLVRVSLDLYSREAISEMRWRQMKGNGSLQHEIDRTRRRFSKTFLLPITSDEVTLE